MTELIAGKDDTGRRLDRILRKALPELSLSLIHRLLRQGKIRVNDQPASPNTRIEQGMVITINNVNHDANTVNVNPVNLKNKLVNNNMVNHKKSMVNKNNSPAALPQILWRGSGIIVFNKPQGLSTHGPHSLDSIVNTYLSGALPCSLSFKPGPLHRLDKPTSGAIAFSETLEGARLFSVLLRERKLEKSYIAIVEGCIEKDELWRDVLAHDKKIRKTFVNANGATSPGAREALTTVKTLASNGEYSLIEARIKTGRHHQIRAQAASHGHPLAGDFKYKGLALPGSGKARGGAYFLHAWKITYIGRDIPDGFPSVIIAPLPESFQSQISALFGARNAEARKAQREEGEDVHNF
jgi:23S rRNA pseudouridine955/2504/2580 synthase